MGRGIANGLFISREKWRGDKIGTTIIRVSLREKKLHKIQ